MCLPTFVQFVLAAISDTLQDLRTMADKIVEIEQTKTVAISSGRDLSQAIRQLAQDVVDIAPVQGGQQGHILLQFKFAGTTGDLIEIPILKIIQAVWKTPNRVSNCGKLPSSALIRTELFCGFKHLSMDYIGPYNWNQIPERSWFRCFHYSTYKFKRATFRY